MEQSLLLIIAGGLGSLIFKIVFDWLKNGKNGKNGKHNGNGEVAKLMDSCQSMTTQIDKLSELYSQKDDQGRPLIFNLSLSTKMDRLIEGQIETNALLHRLTQDIRTFILRERD